MLHGLHKCSPTADSLIRHETCLLGPVEIDFQHREQRNGHEWCDDRECAEGPSPATDILLESLSGSGSCKSGNHVRRRGEGEGESTILQARGIDGNDDIGVDSASGSDGGEDLEDVSATSAWLC